MVEEAWVKIPELSAIETFEGARGSLCPERPQLSTINVFIHNARNTRKDVQQIFGTVQQIWNLSGCHCKTPQSFSIRIFILDFSLNLKFEKKLRKRDMERD